MIKLLIIALSIALGILPGLLLLCDDFIRDRGQEGELDVKDTKSLAVDAEYCS